MAVMKDVLTVFHNIWKDFYNLLREKKNNREKSSRLSQALNIVLIASFVFYGGYRGYRWYISGKEAKAQKMFSESIQLFEEAQKNKDQWNDVEGAFSLGYEQNSTSKLAPFFQLFQAQALVELDKKDEALALMIDALKVMKNNPLLPFYQVKVALLKIDSQDATVQVAGLQELENLAYDDKNNSLDMALYYLGLYYFDKNNVEKTREAWQKLSDLKVGPNAAQSPFTSLVKEKLNQL
ncbi:tetratricopeptide repeat protein [bacterium]|nr:tetratricopeptide repeat protein [bacterium]